jgi:hypothetical protein
MARRVQNNLAADRQETRKDGVLNGKVLLGIKTFYPEFLERGIAILPQGIKFIFVGEPPEDFAVLGSRPSKSWPGRTWP